MNRCVLLCVLLCFRPASTYAQHVIDQKTFDAVAAEFSGEQAQEHIRAIVEYHRIQGSPMMANVAADVVQRRLSTLGIQSTLDRYVSDGRTKYGTFTSPMGWDMRGGELWVESAATPAFRPLRLCRYADVPMCVATYSKGGTWSGELVDVGAGLSDKDYNGKDVRGKVALASGYAREVVRAAVIKRGAVGVVIYPPPDDRPDHPDMVRYNGVWPTAEEIDTTCGGFMISLNQYTTLKRLMASGPVRVRGTIDATLRPGALTLVHAYLRGTERPEQQVVLSAHLDHPKWSANDNASGSAALMEIARTLKALIDAKAIAPPRRTIHFMWVPEYYGTLAYLASHKEVRRCGDWDDPRGVDAWDPQGRQPCVVANLNLDMVGEDTVKTNGRFYFTRTPSSVPSFLDALLTDALAQTREAQLYAATGTRNAWPAEDIPLAVGSDHEAFLGLGIPASMLGHDPDWTHHTSEDTVDKTDASELLRVGTMATAAAYWMASAGPMAWSAIGERAAALNAAKFRIAWAGRALPSGRPIDDLAKLLNDRIALPEAVSALPRGTGLRRLQTVPLDTDVVFAQLSADDQRWWDEQSRRFGSAQATQLPTGLTMELLPWETLNLIDGRRSASEIADILTAEFSTTLEPAWVERMIDILLRKQLVAR